MQAYSVPQYGCRQPLLFDTGIPVRKPTVTVRQLLKRLDDLRKVKLEAEERIERQQQHIKDLCVRLEEVNSVLYRKGDVHKKLYETQQTIHRYKQRMKELGAAYEEVANDYSKLRDASWKIKESQRCIKCGKVRNYQAFPRDPDKPLGRDNRCNICQREKTAKWREGLRAKKLAEFIKGVG